MDTVLDHTRPELPWSFLRHHTIKDQLHPVRPPQIQIVPNDFLEELPPTQGTIEDLRQADFHLPDRQVPIVACLPVFPSQRKRNLLQPLAEHPVDIFRTQRIADLLQCFRLGTGQKSVIQSFVLDLPFLQLPFGPFVPVQAQLRTPRRVAADFDKQRPEVLVIDVEVVVIDVDRFVAIELELSVDLLPVERLRLLLRHTDEDNSVSHLPLPSEVVGNVILSLFMPELIDWHLFAIGLRFDRLAEFLRNLSKNHRRRHRFPQLAAHEHHQPQSCRQLADVAVEVETIQALNFQCDVPIQ